MRQAQTVLTIGTSGQGLTDITAEIDNWLRDTAIATGLLTIFIQHTSASLTIQENADPDVRRDLAAFFKRLVAEDPRLYRHTEEGADDMPAHIRASLTDMSLTIPVGGGRMALGTWQGVYVFEHRASPHRRRVALHVMGE